MVKFSRQYGSYNKDEEATFKPDHEAWLVGRKLATYIKKQETPVAKTDDGEKTGDKDKQPPPGPKDKQTTVGDRK